MRVCVIGAGGTGAFYGSMLLRAGCDVTFVARGRHIEALQSQGLSIRSKLLGDFTTPVRVVGTTRDVGTVDAVLLCVKSYDLTEAANALAPVLDDDTLIVPLQNGIEAADVVGAVVGPERVCGAVALGGGSVTEPGVIVETAGIGRLLVGALDERSTARVRRFADQLATNGFPVAYRENVRVDVFEKFTFACGYSGLTAVTRMTIGRILTCPESRALLLDTIEETARLARASGVALEESAGSRLFAIATGLAPTASSSLAADVIAGRRTEVETLHGAAIRLSKRLDVPAPNNRFIYAALKPQEPVTESEDE